MLTSHQKAGVPYDEVVFLVINEGRNPAIGVDGSERCTLLLTLAQVKVDEFVLEPELFENNDHLPIKIVSGVQDSRAGKYDVPSVGREALVCVKGEISGRGHCVVRLFDR